MFDQIDPATGLPIDQYGNVDYSSLVLSDSLDTNAGANPAAAQATAPVVTNANGTTSVTSGLTSLLGSLGSAYTSVSPILAAAGVTSTAQTAAQANKSSAGAPASGSLAATLSGISSTTWMILAVIGVLIGVLFLGRRKSA
jgi:hypothetical protein